MGIYTQINNHPVQLSPNHEDMLVNMKSNQNDEFIKST